MNRILTTVAIFLPLMISAASNCCEVALQSLGQVDTVTGDAVYEAGKPGEFYLLSQTFLENGSATNFAAMVASTNPIVRLMGAYCIIKTRPSAVYGRILAPLRRDRTRVSYLPVGCIIEHKTVADIVAEFMKNPDVLEWRKTSKKK